jgi:diadenosine tetraphosphate (Ap4A) HIT family hydrolase
MAGCYPCEQEARFDALPPRELIGIDPLWRVAHAFGVVLPGWLVLLPRRHVATIADLTDAESAALGSWQVRLSRALAAVTGCAKTYVAQFAEGAGFDHVHFHVVPRGPDLPADQRGPRVFGLLGRPAEEWVPAERMDELALALRAHLNP